MCFGASEFDAYEFGPHHYFREKRLARDESRLPLNDPAKRRLIRQLRHEFAKRRQVTGVGVLRAHAGTDLRMWIWPRTTTGKRARAAKVREWFGQLVRASDSRRRTQRQKPRGQVVDFCGSVSALARAIGIIFVSIRSCPCLKATQNARQKLTEIPPKTDALGSVNDLLIVRHGGKDVRVARKIELSPFNHERLRAIVESRTFPSPIKRRAWTLLLAYGDGRHGMKNKAIASQLGISRQAVGEWLGVYDRSGLDALLTKPIPGAGRRRTVISDPRSPKGRTRGPTYPTLPPVEEETEEESKSRTRGSVQAIDYRLRHIAERKTAMSKEERQLRARRKELIRQL
jgi:hypothetical protein